MQTPQTDQAIEFVKQVLRAGRQSVNTADALTAVEKWSTEMPPLERCFAALRCLRGVDQHLLPAFVDTEAELRVVSRRLQVGIQAEIDQLTAPEQRTFTRCTFLDLEKCETHSLDCATWMIGGKPHLVLGANEFESGLEIPTVTIELDPRYLSPLQGDDRASQVYGRGVPFPKTFTRDDIDRIVGRRALGNDALESGE